MRLVWACLCLVACASVTGLDGFAVDEQSGAGAGAQGGNAASTTESTSVSVGGAGGVQSGGGALGGGGAGNPGGGGQGGVMQGSGGATSCAALFADAVAECILCEETADACILFCGVSTRMPTSGPCDYVCEQNGSECVAAEDNAQGETCIGSGSILTCDEGAIAEKLCHCSKTCGNGPKCPPGSQCDDGNCI